MRTYNENKTRIYNTFREQQGNFLFLISLQGVSSNTLENLRRSLRERGVSLLFGKPRIVQLLLPNSRVSEVIAFCPITSLEQFPIIYQLLRTCGVWRNALVGETSNLEARVNAGPTEIKMGPNLKRLTESGIDAAIKAGKIEIRQTTNLLNVGEIISPTKLILLDLFDVRPIYEAPIIRGLYTPNGTIISTDILDTTMSSIEQIIINETYMLNLSHALSLPTPSVITDILMNNFRDVSHLEEILSINP